MKIIFFLISVLSTSAYAGSVDWMALLDGAKYEGDFQSCIVGNSTNITDCHVVLEFTGKDQFGALIGRWDFGVQNQVYDVTLEYFPQSDTPYKLGLKKPGYTRRLNSKDDIEDTLNFWPGPGDLEPTIVKLISQNSQSQEIELVFKHQKPMNGENYLMQGTLVRK